MSITINGTTGVSGVDGTAAAPSVQGADSNTGVFFPAADTVAVTTGGTERMRVDSSGNVGIGTSSPAYKLDINSITGWGANQTAPIANIVGANAPTNGGGNLRVLSNTSATADAGGSLVLGGYYTAQTNSIDFAEISGRKQTGQTTGGYLALSTRADLGNSTERMRIDSSGNVGIGTSSPSGAGTTLATQGAYSSIVAGSTSNANFVSFYSGQTIDPNPSILYNNDLRIGSATAPTTAGYAERFRFGSSGQFGIGGANYGTSGQVLTSGGSGAAPSWSAAPAPTTAQVGAATAALAVGDVGSYAWLTYQVASGAVAVGTTFAGANLRYHGVVVVNADAAGACGVWGGAPSGTWRCMGSNGANGGRFPTNIYLRIS